MKNEEEINKNIASMKDALVQTDGAQTILLQGYVRALQWVLSDEKPQDGFSEDV